MKLAEVIDYLEGKFPTSNREAWDFPGLTFGSLSNDVRKILLACDITFEIISYAAQNDCDLIITHHPLFFRAEHLFGGNTFRGSMINLLAEHKIAHYSMHTNADVGVHGVADVAITKVLDSIAYDQQTLQAIIPSPNAESNGAEAGNKIGLGRIVELERTLPLRQITEQINLNIQKHAKFTSRTPLMYAGEDDAIVEKVAILPGSGDSIFDEVRAAGADLYITSDLRHHPTQDQLQKNHQDGIKPLNLINVPHAVIESFWLEKLADDINQQLQLEAVTSPINTDSWQVLTA
jgi:dinuclear metal center YbgI/SA1388 family protein